MSHSILNKEYCTDGDPDPHHYVVNNVFAGDMCRPSNPYCAGWSWDEFPAKEYYPVHRNVKLETRDGKTMEDIYVFKINWFWARGRAVRLALLLSS